MFIVLYSCSEFVDFLILLVSKTYQILGNAAVERWLSVNVDFNLSVEITEVQMQANIKFILYGGFLLVKSIYN